MKSFVKVGAIFALSVMVVSAFAQGGGGGGRGGRGQGGQRGGGVSETQLLGRKDVQAELKITADQKTKADAAMQKARDDRRAAMQNGGVNFQDMSAEERQAYMTKMQAENAAADKKVLESVLTKEQITRLHELYIQRLGNGAVLRADIQKELGITDEQKKKIADLQTKQQEAMRSAFQNGGFQDMSDEERQAAMQKMQETNRKNQEIMNTELGKILTAEQASKLKTMGGAAFKFDPAEDNVRRGGGGRGGN